MKDHDLMKELPPEKVAVVKDKVRRLHAELLDARNETGTDPGLQTVLRQLDLRTMSMPE